MTVLHGKYLYFYYIKGLLINCLKNIYIFLLPTTLTRGSAKKMYKNDWGTRNYTYNVDWGVQYLREPLIINVTNVLHIEVGCTYTLTLIPPYWFCTRGWKLDVAAWLTLHKMRRKRYHFVKPKLQQEQDTHNDWNIKQYPSTAKV